MSLLDHHLCDKTHSAQGHVEELVLLRTELAQEKASLAIVRQELQDHAAREVGVARALHTRKVKELEAELKRKNMERGRVDVQLQELRTKLKGEGCIHLIKYTLQRYCLITDTFGRAVLFIVERLSSGEVVL